MNPSLNLAFIDFETTGFSPRKGDRIFAQKIAIEHGMVIKSGVSKGLDYLVTADPNSLSGKSLKARDYGVKIIAEPVFWSWMNFKVD
jgi:DNA polymerase III subunit epsilon